MLSVSTYTHFEVLPPAALHTHNDLSAQLCRVSPLRISIISLDFGQFAAAPSVLVVPPPFIMLSHSKPFVAVNGQPTPPSSTDHLPIKTISPTSMEAALNGTRPRAHHHIWLVTGPAGCGKSTVAQYIANVMNLPYIEGDEFHPKANIDKMANGIPLTDADRWDWLTALRNESLHRLTAGSRGVVLTCSALKRKYRDVIRVAPYYDQNVLVHFIYLHATEEVLLQRVGARKDHYMGANMVHSQFDILEQPALEETDVITVDVSGTIDQVEREALARVEGVMMAELEQVSY